jgi:Tol biopolymer transport system component
MPTDAPVAGPGIEAGLEHLTPIAVEKLPAVASLRFAHIARVLVISLTAAACSGDVGLSGDRDDPEVPLAENAISTPTSLTPPTFSVAEPEFPGIWPEASLRDLPTGAAGDHREPWRIFGWMTAEAFAIDVLGWAPEDVQSRVIGVPHGSAVVAVWNSGRDFARTLPGSITLVFLKRVFDPYLAPHPLLSVAGPKVWSVVGVDSEMIGLDDVSVVGGNTLLVEGTINSSAASPVSVEISDGAVGDSLLPFSDDEAVQSGTWFRVEGTRPRSEDGSLTVLVSLIDERTGARLAVDAFAIAVPPETQDSLVDLHTGKATPLPETITRLARRPHGYQVSPNGAMLFEGTDRESGTNQLYVVDVGGTGARQLTSDALGASSGSWSPDGTSVVYLGGWKNVFDLDLSAQLSVIETSTGKITRLARGRAGDFLTPFFSTDGRSILFTRGDTATGSLLDHQPQADLWLIPAIGGHPTIFLEDIGFATYPSDGKTIAYVKDVFWQEGHGGGVYPEIWLADANGEDAHLLVRGSDPRWSPDGTRIAYVRASVRVVDVATGEVTKIARGYLGDWLDNHTLIVERYRGRVGSIGGTP